MSFIKEISPGDAQGLLKDIYREIGGKRGKVSNIMKVQSLAPKAMKSHLDLYMDLLYGKSKLKRSERELVATAVSNENKCAYCVNHHAEALKFYWKDNDKIQRFLKNYYNDEISDREKALVKYAVKVTNKPHKVCGKDINYLREFKLKDDDILVLNMIISYFNFVNRIALGLGVEFSEEEVEGYEF
ncbi:MAG: peroxidase-related enzyme [Candidatus Muiribacteriota bacterium]